MNNAVGNKWNCPSRNNVHFCFYCCQGHLCNDELPDNPIVRDTAPMIPSVSLATLYGQQPQWNNTVPQCLDIQPPVFTHCPPDQQFILAPDGPETVEFTIPVVTDNSGIPPVITTTPPGIKSPFKFHTNMTVTYIAVDGAGNNASCSFSIVLLDRTPPEILCPVDMVTEVFNDTELQVEANFTNLVQFGSDVVRIEFVPENGSIVNVTEAVKVHVTAFDASGNEASCSFIYLAQPNGCPEWTLGSPAGGTVACVPPNCELQCPVEKNFVINPDTYTCTSEGIWSPADYVIDCSDKVYPSYYLKAKTTYEEPDDYACIPAYKQSAEEIFRALVQDPCNPSSDRFSTKVSVTLEPQLSNMKGEIDIIFEPVNTTGISRTVILWCATQLLTRLTDNSTALDLLTLNTSNCGDVNSTGPITELDKAYFCPAGLVLKDGHCLACAPGTYHDTATKTCLKCPVGSYQPEYNSSSCLSCPGGTSTLAAGAKTINHCLEKCAPGSFSDTGLEPCVLCHVNMYQPNSGATAMVACGSNLYTAGVGSTSEDDCRAACAPGNYSSDGLAPCVQCSLNHYSSQYKAKFCTQCPGGNVTVEQGSSSEEDCIDWCSLGQCQNSASCERTDENYICHCTPGFTGDLCESEINECLSVPCANNATCVDGVNGYSCQCMHGYEGHHCNIAIDYCQSKPCYNGICLASFLEYECSCFNGWTGRRCDVKIDYCSSNPCQNGTKCVNEDVSYSCICEDPQNTGTNCTEDIDACKQYPCHNGGSCVTDSDGTHCICTDGFTGPTCLSQIDFCQTASCHNGAICINTINGYECRCKDGYTGRHCDHNVNECLSHPCYNGAACVDELDAFKCICPYGFGGVRCEVNRNQCSPHSCMNGGHCIDLINSFICQCPDGFTGAWCEEDVSICEIAPCANNATCIDGVGTDYRCQCLPGFSGLNCTVELDECVSFPCKNNATCKNEIGGFECYCSEGFTGRTCETDVDECSSEPCHNGAKCIDVYNGYICRCPVGYVGIHCETLVDNCLSNPCYNGATCFNGIGSYTCSCRNGYVGLHCEVVIDDCLSNPCQHGANCTDLDIGYKCTCSKAYTGQNCDQWLDYCLVHNPCLNGATCISGLASVTCICALGYTGINCEKELSADFDLYFLGHSSSKVELSPDVYFHMSTFALCFWVRYAEINSTGTILSILSTDNPAKPFFIFKEDGIITNHHTAASLKLWSLSDGKWHHVCLSWEQQQMWYLYKDGLQISMGNTADSFDAVHLSIKVVLGMDTTGQYKGSSFHGVLSQVNVFAQPVTELGVQQLAKKCHLKGMRGDVIAWTNVDSNLGPGVTKLSPSLCRTSKCPPNYTGELCNVSIDKEPPEVIYCPNDTQIIDNNNRLVKVDWSEPVFVDNIRIVKLTQTHRVGQALSHGEYTVQYRAEDGQGNSAVCKFQLFVLPFKCRQQLPPVNGIVDYKHWRHGVYARIKCKDPEKYGFVSLPHKFYNCGKEGIWLPSNGDQFRFPACAEKHPPLPTIEGIILFTGICDPNIESILLSKFITTVKHLSDAVGLCIGDCDFRQVSVECAVGEHRKKRHTSNTIQITFTLHNVRSYVPFGLSSPTSAIEKALKTANFEEAGVRLTHTAIHNVPVCNSGTVLNYELKCVNCPVGTLHEKTSSTCEPCKRGTYNDMEAQTSCKNCPYGRITSGVGAISQSECYNVCNQGWYYDRDKQGCAICPRGYYQSESGQDRCIPCPNGLTTKYPGARYLGQCENLCPPGHELGVSEECVPCPKGTYRNVNMIACVVCPYGYTTRTFGATSVRECTITECPYGTYHTNDTTCALCPLGTYQPIKGTTRCPACPPGKTTERHGSVLVSQCVPVTPIPCLSHDCHKTGGECINMKSEYMCRCLVGWTGDGRTCVKIGATNDKKEIAAAVSCSVMVFVFLMLVVVGVFRKFKLGRPTIQDTFQIATNTQGIIKKVYPSAVLPFGSGNYLSALSSIPKNNHAQNKLYASFKN